MHMKLLAAALIVLTTVPSFAHSANSVYEWTVAETRENVKCRNHVTDLHMRTVPIRNSLLNRDITLNNNGSMHTGHVQDIQLEIREIFQSAKYTMIRAVDFEKCKRVADNAVARIKSVIDKNAY